jgi:hypothetical protein
MYYMWKLGERGFKKDMKVKVGLIDMKGERNRKG